MKKLIALVLAAVMMMTVVSAFGADATMNADVDGVVTVTGLTEGDVAHFYKIIDWQGVTTDADKTNTVGGWVAVAPFNSVLTLDKLKEVLVGDNSVTPVVAATGITAELAGELARVAEGEGTKVDVGADGQAVLGTATDKVTGTYLVLVTPVDVDTVYNPVFVSSDYFENESNEWAVGEAATYSDSAAAKKSTLTLEKTFSSENDYNDDNGQTTKIGQKVDFTVTTTIPGYGKVYEEPKFVINDTLTDLTLDATSVKVYDTSEDPAVEIESTKYDLDTSANSYSISFNKTYLETLTAAKTIKVEYSATVASTALKNINEEDNQVEIVYSHNPNDENDFKVKKDTTQHYTFTIDAEGLGFLSGQTGKKGSEIVKVGVDGNGNPIKTSTTWSTIEPENGQEGPLEGAKFNLYSANPTGAADLTGITVKTNLESGADGRFSIVGLDAGTYYLREEQAPAGYLKDPHVYEIVITPHTKTVTITEYYKVDANGNVTWSATNNGGTAFEYETEVLDWYQVTIDGQEVAKHWFTNPGTSTAITWVETSAVELPSSVVNTKGVELPSTGGIGTTLFYAIGGVMVLAAGIVLVSRRKADEE